MVTRFLSAGAPMLASTVRRIAQSAPALLPASAAVSAASRDAKLTPSIAFRTNANSMTLKRISDEGREDQRELGQRLALGAVVAKSSNRQCHKS